LRRHAAKPRIEQTLHPRVRRRRRRLRRTKQVRVVAPGKQLENKLRLIAAVVPVMMSTSSLFAMSEYLY